ncbi:NAD(P)H-dependent flavin oxidoreductase [Pseudonocardia spinosispora]|uniref:NAD(P)H-dependent flavin oxidoreductase n=1 Tax=Pseudonocardia spinosispora TaxID=103441 RepID=UPI0012EB6391|nr:nitronate monooxygenase [Pseudonocardia spinosispora]
MNRFPAHLANRLRLPLISAPMLRVSGPELVIAACQAGAIGSFPTANARTPERLDEWLTEIGGATGAHTAPYCPNLVIRQPDLAAHLDCLVRHRVELVITSVGSPAGVVGPLHEVGAVVLADVATLAHARKAIATGVDGLVLLTAGAGGQTGWLNGFAFVRAVRAFFDGPVVLAGGISDGVALRAAITLGADLGYMGTRFIAATESMAAPEYRDMLVRSELDDIVLTSAFTGLPTSMLRPAIDAAGLDLEKLDEQVTPAEAADLFGGGSLGLGPKRWTDVYSAGHSVSGVQAVASAAEIIDRTTREYQA